MLLCHEPADFLQNILQITGFNVHVCQTSTCCNQFLKNDTAINSWTFYYRCAVH